jgi:hypothetical protein
MAALTRDDIVGILKPAEDTVVVQILATGATKEEFAEAYASRGSDQCRPEPPVRTGWPDRHDLASHRGRCTRGCISRVVQGPRSSSASGYVHRSARYPGPVRVQAWAGCRAPCRDDGLRFSTSLDRADHNVMEAGTRQRGALSSAAEVRDNSTSWPRSRPAGQKGLCRHHPLKSGSYPTRRSAPGCACRAAS